MFTKLFAVMACGAVQIAAAADWTHYGADEGGTRYSEAAQITPENVSRLVPAWTFHTGDLKRRPAQAMRRASLQGTPILVDGRLVLCTPFNEVIALDPGTGEEQWRFDPEIDQEVGATATASLAEASRPGASRRRTRPGRAHDGSWWGRMIHGCSRSTSSPASHVRISATDGAVTIDPGMELVWPGEFQITSPPVIVGDVIVIGSSISDNSRVAAPHGTVRAFDVRTGAPQWTMGSGTARSERSGDSNLGRRLEERRSRKRVGADVDGCASAVSCSCRPRARALTFSAACDPATTHTRTPSSRCRRRRASSSGPISSCITTCGTTTRRANRRSRHCSLHRVKRDVVIQGTKQGFVFVLDRDTGEPVLPVEERAVPQNGVAGEVLSPTQPIPDARSRARTADDHGRRGVRFHAVGSRHVSRRDRERTQRGSVHAAFASKGRSCFRSLAAASIGAALRSTRNARCCMRTRVA